MTRKHYEAIAAVLNTRRPIPGSATSLHLLWESIVEELIGYFSDDNPNFLPNRFQDACHKEKDPPE